MNMYGTGFRLLEPYTCNSYCPCFINLM